MTNEESKELMRLKDSLEFGEAQDPEILERMRRALILLIEIVDRDSAE